MTTREHRALALAACVLAGCRAREQSARAHVLIPTAAGLYLSEQGVPAGRLWAVNGDGYWEHVARTRAVRAKPGGPVDADARIEEITCNRCSSAHPSCAGRKPVRHGGSYSDYLMHCRLDAGGVPWCVMLGTYRGVSVSGASVVRVIGDAIEARPPWAKSGPEVKPLWFPPAHP